MTVDWAGRYAERIRRARNNAIEEILKLTQRPEMISFAGGLPAAELFPVERVLEATQCVLKGPKQHEALQYGVSQGYTPLREMIAEQVRATGARCTAENVLVTSGSQQALDLIGKVFINPGDCIAVEEPTYLGMLDAWNVYGATYATVATDECGMISTALQEVLEHHPIKLIYLVPNFQNPTGVTTTLERRVEIVRLARRYGVPVVEDDPYGMLRYEGDPLAPLLAIDAGSADTPHGGNSRGGGGADLGNVIQLGTFSKTLCPGLRVAWIVAPAEVIQRLAQTKQDGDLHTSTFAQAVVYETARDGFLEQHVNTLRTVYGKRRTLMLDVMEVFFPGRLSWTRPQGGLFVWVRLPAGADATDLLKEAVGQGVAYVPGSPFYPNGGGANTLRMNFSNADPTRIEQGVRRLASVFERACEKALAG